MTRAPVAARWVLFAYHTFGARALAALLARGERVVAVVTHADDPSEGAWFESVAELARARRVPVFAPPSPDAPGLLETLRALEPDVLLSVWYRRLLGAPLLGLPRVAALNVHGSLLPRYRGRAPVNWAVLHGETEAGATLHVMTARADAGDIVDQEAVPIGPDDAAAEVQARVCSAAVTILGRQLEALLGGTAPRRPQDAAHATTFRRRHPDDGAFEWSRPARAIHDLVRAVSHPYPGAFTTLGGRRLFVWRTREGDWSANGTVPGEMRVIDDRLYVACGDGRWLEVVRAQLEGEPERDGAELARRLAPGPSRSTQDP